ncbi:MAG: molybdate ABC transporter substrate-binding protein [Deltaproteobacteria bacterium]|nr:molybdate ABC transporter substrate-binding protein [Deltaproteobacteria bacterium]MBZ0219586.1 molybdate ABC transporter substrate-binding protein [Deltaproteobacteria bacterium]
MRSMFKAFLAALLPAIFFLSLSEPIAFAGDRQLTVAGAATLSFAFKDIAAEFEKETGYKVVLSMGSTGMLAKQIEHGAPFDVFFAADIAHMEGLAEKGKVIPETMEPYARGRIVLAVRKGSGITANGLEDLVAGGYRIAIANPDHAPYGKAAMEAMKSAGIWDKVKPRLVYGENIRQALQFVQSGNAPVGFVSLSIAGVPEIDYILVQEELHDPIEQAAAVVSTSKEAKAARDFIKFVKGPKGALIMKKYGFMLPEGPK